MRVQTNPDPSRDSALEIDLPRVVTLGALAGIGDSITVRLGGDRIKVTLLEFIDPAVVQNPGIDGLFDALATDLSLGDILAEPETTEDARYVAVQLRMRNLDASDPGSVGIVRVFLSGVLIDTDGQEHRASIASIKDGDPAMPPQRGEPSSIGSIPMRIPPL